MRLSLPLLVLLAATAAQPRQARPDDTEYRRCIRQIQSDASAAFEMAMAWRARGGGAAAAHCAAIARLQMNQPVDAAQRLEALAEAMRPVDAVVPGGDRRADVLAQAGHAWLLARQPDRAAAAMAQALALKPDDPELYIDRAMALTAAGRCWEAIDDLNKASEMVPDRGDILIFRAACYRLLNSLELAESDADHALKLDPQSVDALLERGVIRASRGNRDGAREDLMMVLTMEPEGPAADAARTALEALDVRR